MQALKNASLPFEKEEYKRIMKGGSPLKYCSYNHQKEYQASSVSKIPSVLAGADNNMLDQLKAFEYLKSIMGMTTTAQANKIHKITAGAARGSSAGGSNGQGGSASSLYDLGRILNGFRKGLGMGQQVNSLLPRGYNDLGIGNPDLAQLLNQIVYRTLKVRDEIEHSFTAADSQVRRHVSHSVEHVKVLGCLYHVSK
ncbi:hypothetical protein HDU76_008492, partial [Blyttiomyces sp. JEL0837]